MRPFPAKQPTMDLGRPPHQLWQLTAACGTFTDEIHGVTQRIWRILDIPQNDLTWSEMGIWIDNIYVYTLAMFDDVLGDSALKVPNSEGQWNAEHCDGTRAGLCWVTNCRSDLTYWPHTSTQLLPCHSPCIHLPFTVQSHPYGNSLLFYIVLPWLQ